MSLLLDLLPNTNKWIRVEIEDAAGNFGSHYEFYLEPCGCKLFWLTKSVISMANKDHNRHSAKLSQAFTEIWLGSSISIMEEGINMDINYHYIWGQPHRVDVGHAVFTIPWSVFRQLDDMEETNERA